MTTNDAVATRILKLLKQRNMTQYRLEKLSGITHGNMDGILNSSNKTVTLTTLYRIARGFNMSLIEFLDDEVFLPDNVEVE